MKVIYIDNLAGLKKANLEACLKGLEYEKVYASKIAISSGYHPTFGLLPQKEIVDCLVTLKMPFTQIEVAKPICDLEGIQMLASLNPTFSKMPDMKVEKVIENGLRVYLGELETSNEIVVMETNIDDCSGELLGHTMKLLMEAGALDVFFTSIYMKKNRPAYCLSVICKEENREVLAKLIFENTTTIGIRYRYEKRMTLKRAIVSINTPYGLVKAKQVEISGKKYTYPEYEELKQLSLKLNMPLKALYDEMKKYV